MNEINWSYFKGKFSKGWSSCDLWEAMGKSTSTYLLIHSAELIVVVCNLVNSDRCNVISHSSHPASLCCS